MPVSAVTRKEYDKLKHTRSPHAETAAVEVEWFVADDGAIIGALSFDKGSHDWAFVVLGRDTHGHFRAIDLAHGIKARGEARSQLLAMMERHVATG